MANMTRNHFELIADAVNEGVRLLMKDVSLNDIISKDTFKTDNEQSLLAMKKKSLALRVRTAMAHALASKLKYTNDHFDTAKFVNCIIQAR